MTSVNAVGIRADATDKEDHTLGDANTNPKTQVSMFPKNKTAIEMFSLLAAVQGINQFAQLFLQHVFVQESLVWIVMTESKT